MGSDCHKNTTFAASAISPAALNFLSLLQTSLRGCLYNRAEIIPLEPDPDNAGVGKRRSDEAINIIVCS
jgi:hypothetical protein